MDLLMLPIYILLTLLGIMVGSFCNVCILRIPAGQSVVTGPSHCMTCGKRLKWWELIPLFSWLALRGRCSACRAAISPQYPLIEAANGLAWLAALLRFGITVDGALAALLFSCLLVAAVIDARTRELPAVTTGFVAALGLVRAVIHYADWQSSLLGFLVVGGVLFLLFMLSGGSAIGGGDVKLMAGAGLFLGLKLNLMAFFFGCVLGSVIHIFRMKFRGAGRDLALGPYLAAGIVIALLFGDWLWAWYIAQLG